jgi:hypothetical protein
MIFAIDFDGTLCEEKWPKIGEPRKDSLEFVRLLHKAGHKWILLTMREGVMLDAAIAWIKAMQIPFPDCVNVNLPERCNQWGDDPRKVYADVYIDDHNAGGLLLPWGILPPELIPGWAIIMQSKRDGSFDCIDREFLLDSKKGETK